MKISHILITTFLLTATLAKIGPGQGIPDAVIVAEDSYSQNMAKVFDLSEMQPPVSFHSDTGRVIGDNEAVQMKHYEAYGVEKLFHIEHVSDILTAFVYDNSKVVFQLLDHNGKAMLKHWFYDFNTILKSVYCTGFAFNEQRNLLYVGCNEAGTPTDPGQLLVATYDIGAEDVTSQLVMKQDDGFRIVNRLEMFITVAPQDSNEEIYLVAYDKGKSIQTKTRQDNKIRVFRNVAYRRLTYYLLADIEFLNGDIDIVYDLFPYGNSMLATARVGAAGTIITMAQCVLNNGDEKLRCGAPKGTLIKNGFINYQNGRVQTVCTDTKTVTVYQTMGEFSSADWMTKVLDQMTDVNLIPGSDNWIRDVTSTEYGAILSYQNATTDSGVCFIYWGMMYSDHYPDMTGFSWDRSLILGDLKTGHVGVFRTILSAVWIEGFTLNEGANKVTVTGTDANSTQSAHATITVAEDIFSMVSIGAIPPANVTAGKVAHLETDGGFMAAVEMIVGSTKQIHYGHCGMKNGVVPCTELGTVSMSSDDMLMNRIVHLGKDNLLMYSVNARAGSSIVYIMNKDEAHKKTFKELVVDVNALTGPKMNFVSVAFASRVELYQVNPNDAAEWKLIDTVDANSYGVARFCPVSISHPAPSTNLMFEILSTCQTHSIITSSSSIFQLSVTSHSNNHFIPLSNLDTPASVCSFGQEHLVASDIRAYGVSPADDFNYWTIPFEDLQIKRKEFTVSCIDNQETAIVWGTSTSAKNGNQKTAYVLRGNSGWRQDRRYPSMFVVDADIIENFGFAGGVMSVVYEAGDAYFLQSYVDPVIIAVGQAVTKETKVHIDVTAKNGMKSGHTTIEVNVMPKSLQEE